MSVSDAFGIAGAVVVALGGGGALVFGLSNWLGKVWADRLMAGEKARHNQDLETLRASLQAKFEHFSQTYRQKIDLYKEVSNPLIDLVVKAEHAGTLTAEDLKAFDKSRLQTTALLAMFAPKPVFEEYNQIIDFIYNTIDGEAIWSFSELRTRALRFLSLVRKDIGIYDDDISYNGSR